jgi:hypothetical protein
MKPVEIILRRGEEGRKRAIKGGESKIYCKHTCRYHNVSPVQLLYANKKFKNPNQTKPNTKV